MRLLPGLILAAKAHNTIDERIIDTGRVEFILEIKKKLKVPTKSKPERLLSNIFGPHTERKLTVSVGPSI